MQQTHFAKIINTWSTPRVWLFIAPLGLVLPVLSGGCTKNEVTNTEATAGSKSVAAGVPPAIRPQLVGPQQSSKTQSVASVRQVETPLPTQKQIAALERVQKLAAKWADAKVTALPPNKNYGILICEPGAQDDLAPFGAGLTRWLQFHVGGQGSLGKTPAWAEIEVTRRVLKKPNLQLSSIDVVQLPPLLGITHAVTGRLDRAEQNLVLSLQLWRLGKHGANWENVPVGDVVELRGSRQQIIQQLPTIARLLSQQLGIKSSAIPARVEVNAEELQFLGALPRDAKANTSTRANPLRPRLHRKSALANLLLLSSSTVRDVRYEIAPRIENLAPRNTLAWNSLVQSNSSRAMDNKLKKLRREFPQNYALAEAKNAVRCSVLNPHAWLRINAPKRDSLFGALQATRQAPRMAKSWREVSRRAYTLGEKDVAQLAFWKALRLDETDWQTWRWGETLLGRQGLRDPKQYQKLKQFQQRRRRLIQPTRMAQR